MTLPCHKTQRMVIMITKQDYFGVNRGCIAHLRNGRGLRVGAVLRLDGLDLLDEEIAVQTELRHLGLQTVGTW